MERARGMFRALEGAVDAHVHGFRAKGSIGRQAVKPSVTVAPLSLSLNMQPHEASLRPDDGAAATSLAEDQLTDATDPLCMMMRPPAELWDGQTEE